MTIDDWKAQISFAAKSITICIAAFLLLIANGLTNTYDGMWKGAYYDGYHWVISIGRWFWPVIGILRTNKSPEPFTSIISLIIFVVGGCIVTYWFETKSLLKRYVVVLFSVINTSVCAMLSYRFTSPTFAVSYLFSVLAVFILRKPDWKKCIIAIALLAMSLGSYQVNLGCACVLVLLWIVKLIIDGHENREIVRFVVFAAISILISCIGYKVAWDLALKVFSLEASTYRGAGSLSVWNMILSLPKSIQNAYIAYGEYYFKDIIKHNVYQPYIIYKMLFVLLWAVTIIKWTMNFVRNPQTSEKLRGFVSCLMLALIPPASNVYMLMAVDAGDVMIQMTLPMAISVPFMLCITNEEVSERIDLKFVKNNLSVIIAILILIGNWMMVSVDQQIMLNGRLTSINMMNRIVSDIDGDIEPAGGYVFIGKPADNPGFMKEDLWKKANAYAQFGNIWTGGDCCTQSYNGLLRESGINLDLNSDQEKWHELEKLDEVKNMPVYPHAGCMKMIDDSLVIKVSEY